MIDLNFLKSCVGSENFIGKIFFFDILCIKFINFINRVGWVDCLIVFVILRRLML